MIDPTDEEGPDDPPGAAGGGAWLTYRYRMGGGDTPEAAGTIKAPSFMTAARQLLARRLADRVGAVPVYLRLRAAGEREVLLRVTRGLGAAGRPAELEVVPPDTYRFPEPIGPDDAA